ncbi:MAG: hypothetical protein GY696_31015 [Gammaproteobacteria bacterium]|nr:hypothetical protein [Gammaproteobacteria bacterium]
METDADGQSTSKEKKISQVNAKIPEGNPSKGVPWGLSKIADYCFDGTVRVTSGFSKLAIKCPVDIEGFRVNAVLDMGPDIYLALAKCFKSFAMPQNRADFLPKFRPVDRKFFTYNRGEIGHLKAQYSLRCECFAAQ